VLIVNIAINNQEIGVLTLRRKNDVTVEELMTSDEVPCRYEARYSKPGEDVIEFEVDHDYHDKAELLTARALVMARAIELAKQDEDWYDNLPSLLCEVTEQEN
jgi:hypothetical protein